MLNWIIRILLLVFVLLVASVLGVRWIGNRPINPARQDVAPSNPIPQIQLIDATVPSPSPLANLNNGQRMTTLIMGVDRRQRDDGYTLTDTIMLLSIDPVSETASVLSIPRDLLVEIPGFRPHRINAAFILGAQEGGDEAGVQLAMQTVSQNLNVNIDHYALLDFQTVVNVIDALGGVTVRVPQTIDDPQYPDGNYGYDPFYIAAGEQLLDGNTALKYMRSRHGSTDFGRAQRQQQVLLAFRQQLLTRNSAELITLAPSVVDKLRDGFFTSLSTNEIVTLSNVATHIPTRNISMAVLDYEYVQSQATENQGTVLVIRPEKVSELIAQLFY
jgi:LCP family protein required for cell wall assembly